MHGKKSKIFWVRLQGSSQEMERKGKANSIEVSSRWKMGEGDRGYRPAGDCAGGVTTEDH